jgi:DhnA family fructose-bisphosphate aldolase class Ia
MRAPNLVDRFDSHSQSLGIIKRGAHSEMARRGKLVKIGSPDRIVPTAKVKVKVQFTVERAKKVHWDGRGIALLFLYPRR